MFFKRLSLVLGLILSLPALAVTESPISHRVGEFLQSIQNDPKAGEKIYDEFCASCHAVKPAIEVGAPRFKNPVDWQKYSHQSMTALLAQADTGMGNMPPRGGCFECSDKDLEAAIVYMMPPTKPNS